MNVAEAIEQWAERYEGPSAHSVAELKELVGTGAIAERTGVSVRTVERWVATENYLLNPDTARYVAPQDRRMPTLDHRTHLAELAENANRIWVAELVERHGLVIREVGVTFDASVKQSDGTYERETSTRDVREVIEIEPEHADIPLIAKALEGGDYEAAGDMILRAWCEDYGLPEGIWHYWLEDGDLSVIDLAIGEGGEYEA